MKILIIGGRGGIAYLAARRLVLLGHLVYLCVHTEEQLLSLKEQLGDEFDNLRLFKLDVTIGEDLQLIEDLSYDVIWAHAGIGNGGTLLAMDVDVLRDNYDVNVFGTMEVVRRAYLKFKKDGVKGKIFVTSSLAGMLPFSYLGCYTSSKAALSMLCFTLKKELKQSGTGITITLIEPGAYRTGFNEVMIDNKEQFLDRNSIFYLNFENINKFQRRMFSFLEKKNYSGLVDKIIREMLREVPKFKIKKPFFQVLFTKIYLLFIR